MALQLAPLLLLLAGAPDPGKPAAITVCFNGLSPERPLFSPTPARNYRKFSEDSFILDVDVSFNGTVAPSKLSKAPGVDCLKAWVPAQPVSSIEASFARTDTNLAAESRKVSLKLKPDLWYDGGRMDVRARPFAQVTSSAPGTLSLTRRPPMSPEVPAKVTDLQHVPAGDYALDFQPPGAPEVACDLALTAEATGTVTTSRHPEVLAQVLESYRREFAPSVLAAHKVHCHRGEQVGMKISVYDGVVLYPLAPDIRVSTKPGAEPRYRLTRAGLSEPFKLGSPVHVSFGEVLTLEPETPGALPSARASASSP